MNVFAGSIMRFVQLTMYVLALYVLGWGFLPYPEVFLSLGTGCIIGLYNVWSMYRDVRNVGAAAEENKRTFSFGMVSRLAAGALAAILLIRFPDYFHIIGLVAGLMTPYAIIFFYSLWSGKGNRPN
ncbi:ATP synthase subunit I [Alteribacillus sp. HJP-4]|uniref:ATP synthase subunit I n=1 Tax=Alteribacillus sp. HJP-4 TaxID=2775394 RepID=UPI0035CD12CD